ncbi:cell division protein FtsB [Neisseria sp. HSC-16F19]|nr:cell division protein FtsB [Neisseria sp. HSC-16F19]MCP2039546.1 cell division protein FtsB [Neisseria sp. HSC-16F19]
MRWVTYVLILALAGLQYSLWMGKGGWGDMQQLAKQAEQQQQANMQLNACNRALEAEVQDLAEGSDAIAEIARVDLGYVQDGETFYRFVYVQDNQE